MVFLTEILKIPKIHIKLQETPNSQDHLKQEEQSWRHHTSWLQNISQSYSNQDSMALALK